MLIEIRTLSFQLLETQVVLRVRQVDVPIIESILGDCTKQYKQLTKKDVHVKVDTENYLSPESCGGAELLAMRGTI